MTRSFFQYPTGLVGWALLLLRGSLALALTGAATLVPASWAEPPAFVIAAMLLVGAFTRVAAGFGVAAAVLIGAHLGGSLGASALLHGLASLALSMTGAGGYSVDALLFGRKVITIE